MIVEAMGLSLLVGLAALSYRLHRSMMHPAFVFCALWAAQFAGLLVWDHLFFQPSSLTYVIVCLGATSFFLGAHLLAPATPGLGEPAVRVVRTGRTLFFMVAVVVALSIAGQYQAFSSVAPGETFEMQLVYVRLRFVVEDEDIFGLYKYGNAIAVAALLFVELRILRGKGTWTDKGLFVFFLVSTILMGVLSTGRGPIAFTLALACVLYALVVGIKVRTFAVLLSVACGTFAAFWIMGRAMMKAGDDFTSAIEDLVTYAFNSLPALSVHLQRNDFSLLGGEGGENTFRFFIAVASALGWTDRPPNLVQPFVSVPSPTNLYTSYMHYLADFGVLGALLFAAFLGLVHGKLFQWVQRRPTNDYALFVLTISYLPLLQTVFQETHFTSLSQWIQYALLGLLFTRSNAPRKLTWIRTHASQ